jgi:prolyl-tRNA synthetase
MYLSKYYLPLIKENPSEAKIVSHRLMFRAGMIRQVSAGIYNWLPLGIAVLRNIEAIIKKRMKEIDVHELLMPCIQNAEVWKESGRYDAYGPEMLRIKDRHDNELLFSPTNEDLFTDIIRSTVKSYKQLPLAMYQTQWKFRDEIRPRFGVMRGREFYMKDAYSLDIDKESALESYNKMFKSYVKIFNDMELNAIPVKGDPGPIGGKHNHEFQIIAETGESEIYYDKKFDEINKEELDVSILDKVYTSASEVHNQETCGVLLENLICKKAIEVGHIFYFGTKYSDPMKAYVNDEKGDLVPLHMGSYGIGVSRLVGAIIEASHDDKGIIWPKSVAPFKVSIINLSSNEQTIDDARNLYNKLMNCGIEVLFDDTSERAGAKFATHDLVGIPFHVIIGKRFETEKIVELKCRKTSNVETLNIEELFNKLKDIFNVK